MSEWYLFVGCLLGASIPFAWRKLLRKKACDMGAPRSTGRGVWFCWRSRRERCLRLVRSGGSESAWLAIPIHGNYVPFYRTVPPEQMQGLIATDVNHMLATSLSAIIEDPRLDLYKEQRKTQPSEDVIQNMNRNLVIAPSGQYFTISFEYPDRMKAQETVFQCCF